jgi:hypothetical protein
MMPSRYLYFAFGIVAIGLCLLATFGLALDVLLGCLVIPVVWLGVAFGLRKTLVCEDIALSPHGTLEREFDVPVSETYELFLEFEKRGHADDELRALIGIPNRDELHALVGMPKVGAATGVAVPVRWFVIDAVTGQVAVSGERATSAANSWSGSHVKRFVDRFALPRGHFLFRGEVVRDVAPLQAIHARMRLCFEPAHGHSWRNAASFMLAFTSSYVAIPVALFCGIVLMLRAFAA